MASLPACGCDVDPRRRGRRGLRALDRDIETVEPRNHRPPFRELPIGIDEKRQRGLHAAEGGRRLHQAAELDRAGKIGGADDDEGKDGRYLGIARREEGELLGAQHDLHEVTDQPSEPVEQLLALIGLAAQEGDLLGILPHPNEVEAEVGFEPLLAEIEPHQRPADEVRQRGPYDRIEQSGPHQIPWNGEARAEQMERGSGRKGPQDDDEGEQRDDGAEQAHGDRQRALDEEVDVLGDALVRVVGGIAEKLHAVVVGVGKPTVEILPRQPAPPADLQPLVQVELIDREHDERRRQRAEEQQLPDEVVPVALLQRVVEPVIPLIEHDVDRHGRQFDGDDCAKQDAAGPAVLGDEIGTGKPPDEGERGKKA